MPPLLRVLTIGALLPLAGCVALDMPGRSLEGPLPEPSPTEIELRERGERDDAMLSLEMIGYYSDAKKSQSFPFSWIYPSRANFIGFITDYEPRRLLKRAAGLFRESVSLDKLDYDRMARVVRGLAGVVQGLAE